METTENPTNEVIKTSQSTYVTIDEKISRMKITFGNATLPGIFETMQSVGYTAEKIDSMKAKLTGLENLQVMRNKEYAEQLAESAKFDTKRTELDVQYSTHRKLAKILFKTDVQAQSALQLDSPKPAVYASWVQQVSGFYQQLNNTALFKQKVSAIGITADVISRQLLTVDELQALRDSQRKELSEAQTATDARDKAFDELYTLYMEYIQYAKVLLADNQALEAIGVTVKAK